MPDTRALVTLDVRGEICPSPLIQATEAMNAAGPDEVIAVVTDYFPALLTVPNQALRVGWDVQIVKQGPSEWTITLTRSAFPPEDAEA